MNGRVLFMGVTLLKSETSKENVNHSRVYEVNVNQKYFRPTSNKYTNETIFIFFELTNGTDIEIAQYKKELNGEWFPLKINPNKCVE